MSTIHELLQAMDQTVSIDGKKEYAAVEFVKHPRFPATVKVYSESLSWSGDLNIAELASYMEKLTKPEEVRALKIRNLDAEAFDLQFKLQNIADKKKELQALTFEPSE